MIFLSWYMWAVDNGDSWNYQGGLTAVAIASAFVIMAASYPGTFANKIFSLRILRSIGLVSYSVYLIHVLVFDALSPANLVMNNKVRLLLALVIIFGYAVIVYFAVEKPLSRVRARLHVRPGAR
jgi:peptidoglycan/LPS O-acetylase OafA/YrhL